MVKGVKPYLGGLQEFGTAAYVKDLTAGKLDPRSVKGHFVGYDSESKGYRIYWPEKRTVSVERNVVFNPDDLLVDETVVVPGDVLAEGERDKVIQNDSGDNEAKNEGETVKMVENNEKRDIPPNTPLATENDPPNTDPTVPPQLPKRTRESDTLDEPEPNTGCGFRARPKPGAYARMNSGLDPLEVNMAFEEGHPDDADGVTFDFNNDDDGWYALPPEFACAGSMDDEPKSYREAMNRSDSAQWKAAWDKEIGSLEKARTWELVDRPPNVPVIPCTLVFKTK
jgi:hypothetical protein